MEILLVFIIVLLLILVTLNGIQFYFTIIKNNHRNKKYKQKSSSYDVIMYRSHKQALEVYNSLKEISNKFGFVSVADLYALSDCSAKFSMNKYGWTYTSIAYDGVVTRNETGFYIALPEPVKL